MLDIKFIRENKELIKEGAIKKRINFDIDELLNVDQSRVSQSKVVDDLRARQNEVSSIIVKSSDIERISLLSEMQILKEKLKLEEEKLISIMREWQKLMLTVPNIPDMSVPVGDSDADNVEIRKWGVVKNYENDYNFTPKDHIAIMEQNDMVDFERGVKASGFRGYFLKNEGALLEMAIWQYVMHKWQNKNFIPMLVPSMVRREALLGTGYLPAGEEDLYKDGNDYLAGTGEVATMYYHSGEIINNLNQELKYIVWSPCFRKEAGSHSKDIKGLIRVHEFYKCEQVVLCRADHSESVRLHEEITKNAEDMMMELGLPYHVVVNCSADLGQGQVKKYDIEVWMPSQGKYRETHSASYFHDFQTRRLNIKYRDADGSVKFAHSLNNTAAATPRLLAAIVENYQNADGSINVPEILQPYMNGIKIINAKKQN
jgi:seryl-tRNA synthetase